MGFGQTPMLRTRSILALVALLAFLGSCRYFDNNDDPVGPSDDSGQGDDYVDPCSDPLQVCNLGDVNQNGLAYEIADYITLKNYFLIGDAAFPEEKVEEAMANGDINRDGIECSAADLACMCRVIIGDLPRPSPQPVSGDLRLCNGVVSSPHYRLGTAAFVIKGEVTPVLLAPRMRMECAFDGTNTRVIVHSIEGNSMHNEIVDLGGELVSADFGTDVGAYMPAVFRPTEVVMGQNFPNPFSTTTTIPFEFPGGGPWQIDIRSWNGQKAAQFSGNSLCGVEDLIWDGTSLPSGTYYYTLKAGGKSITRIATLSK